MHQDAYLPPTSNTAQNCDVDFFFLSSSSLSIKSGWAHQQLDAIFSHDVELVTVVPKFHPYIPPSKALLL